MQNSFVIKIVKHRKSACADGKRIRILPVKNYSSLPPLRQEKDVDNIAIFSYPLLENEGV